MKHLALLITLFFLTQSLTAQTKALVGGRLIDGFGGHPIANSVIIIEDEIITKVGHQGNTPIPEGAEIISTEGMDVLPVSYTHLTLPTKA